MYVQNLFAYHRQQNVNYAFNKIETILKVTVLNVSDIFTQQTDKKFYYIIFIFREMTYHIVHAMNDEMKLDIINKVC